MVGSHDILVINLGQWLDGGQMTSTLTKNEPKQISIYIVSTRIKIITNIDTHNNSLKLIMLLLKKRKR